MRIVFIGASLTARQAAIRLIEEGHEVIIIETNQDIINDLSDTLDCSFVHGDGTSPEILKETNPKSVDILFCLTGEDHSNIIAGLVGNSLGMKRVIVSINNSEWENICFELGLEDTIVPVRTIGKYLTDLAKGRDLFELSNCIKKEASLFTFTASEKETVPIKDLSLPENAKVVWFYRDGSFNLADEEKKLKKGDEVVIATLNKNLEELKKRWKKEESPKKEK